MALGYSHRGDVDYLGCQSISVPVQPFPTSRDIALPSQHALLRPSLHWFVAKAAVRRIDYKRHPVPPLNSQN